MKFYTKAEFGKMSLSNYIQAVAEIDLEASSLGVRGMDLPLEVVRSLPRIYKVLELQQRIVRKRANLVVNASMMSLVEEGE